MKTRSKNSLVARAIGTVLLALSLAACSGADGSTTQPTADGGPEVSPPEPTSVASPAATPTGASADPGAADQVGDNRQGVVTLVEAQFQAFNAQANWEADTLVLTLDGDVNNELDGFLICGTIHEMIEPGLKGRVEFPNGTLDCEEIRS